ncbi:MAG: UDP-3-O-(3-hydroxymyristoyl)glucosamine N-acyltransferase [Endomicrobiales bacterium]|nr:UDP-3-O-(3-hydroxymyristoyl)glucosamine N-acyltransferase [Endomicrobiales bacterium]
MEIKTSDLAKLVGGALEGDGAVVIRGATSLEDAGQNDVSFISNRKYEDLLASTKAGVVIMTEEFRKKAPGNKIVVKEAQTAFAMVLQLVEKERKTTSFDGIHPTAVVSQGVSIGKNVHLGPHVVVDENAAIGENTRIMAQVFVGRGASIGKDCLIYPNVTVRESVRIGDRVIIHSGAVVGSDGFGFITGKNGIMKIPQTGTVEIGDDAELGANVSIDRATVGATKIGRGTKLDNLVHVAHNVQIGENCMLAGQTGIAGSTRIGNNVITAGQVGITGHVKVGNNVMMAGKTVISNNVEDNSVLSGFPARPHKENLRIQALIHKLPKLFEEVKKLKEKK